MRVMANDKEGKQDRLISFTHWTVCGDCGVQALVSADGKVVASSPDGITWDTSKIVEHAEGCAKASKV